MIDPDNLYQVLRVRHGKTVAELQNGSDNEGELLGRKKAYEELIERLNDDHFRGGVEADHGELRTYENLSTAAREFDDPLDFDFESD